MIRKVNEKSQRLQESKRRAVRAEIADAAERLFLARGYEATTVEDIAGEVGMSLRSVYRYFPTKDDVLVSRFVTSGLTLVEGLRSRPEDESAWDSMRAALEPLTQHLDNQPDQESARRLHRAIFDTATLTGRYLQQLHETELTTREVLRERPQIKRQLATSPGAEIALFTLVSCAFACFVTAQDAWSRRTDDLPFAVVLTQALDAIKPTT